MKLALALKEACDALLMLSIKGTNELPGVCWHDMETEIPVSVEQLQEVLKKRRFEAADAFRKASAVLDE